MDVLQRDRKYVLTIGDYKTGDGVQITDLQIRFRRVEVCRQQTYR